MNIKLKKLICLKLVNGDNIVCELVKETILSYVVKNTLSIMYESLDEIRLIDWLIGVEASNEIKIIKKNVISKLKPNNYLTDMYNSDIIKALNFEKFKDQSLDDQERAMGEYIMKKKNNNTPTH